MFVKKDTFESEIDEYDELFDYDKLKQKYQLKDNLKDYYKDLTNNYEIRENLSE